MLGRRQRTKVRNGPQGAATGTADDEDNGYEGGADAKWETASAAGGPAGGQVGSLGPQAEAGEEEDEAGYEYDDETDEYDEDADETDEYSEDDVETDEDEYEEDDDETDEYDDDDVDDYDDDVDDYDDETGDEDGDDQPEPFTPPTFLEAAKQAFRPKRLTPPGTAADTSPATATSTSSGRRRAQPATGTDADARAVNLLDRREQTIGFVLGVGLVALSALAYLADQPLHEQGPGEAGRGPPCGRRGPDHLRPARRTEPPRHVLQAAGSCGLLPHFQRACPLPDVGILFGLLYLGGGGWLIFRAMQRSPKSRARQAALAAKSDGRTGRAGTGSTGGVGTKGAASARASSGGGSAGTASRSTSSSPQRQIGRNNRSRGAATTRGASSASGRYTPPKQNRRPAPPKQPDPPEASNRLTAWLRK